MRTKFANLCIKKKPGKSKNLILIHEDEIGLLENEVFECEIVCRFRNWTLFWRIPNERTSELSISEEDSASESDDEMQTCILKW